MKLKVKPQHAPGKGSYGRFGSLAGGFPTTSAAAFR